MSTFRSCAVVVWTLLAGALVFAQAPATQSADRRVADSAAALRRLPASPTHARIQTRTYDFKEAGKPMTYELFVPSGYDRNKPTPLVVALHGLRSAGRQIIRYESLTELAEARGYIIVAPTGYNDHGWYGSIGAGGGRDGDPPNLGELSEKDVMNVVEIVRGEFNVDPKRMYLFGHSMGGGGALHLGIKYPDLWAALAPVAPAIYTSPEALKAIPKTPIIVVMGDQDRLVSVEVTRRWVEQMKSLGMNYKYIEIPGGDHVAVITRSPENMRAIFDFFDQAKRE